MHVLTITLNGFAKRTEIPEFRVQNRGGTGIGLIDASARNGRVLGSIVVAEEDSLIVVSTKGQCIRVLAADIRSCGRNAQGVRLLRLAEGDAVAGVTRVATGDDVLVSTREGQCIRFSAEQTRLQKLGGNGVRAIDVADGDEVANVISIEAPQ